MSTKNDYMLLLSSTAWYNELSAVEVQKISDQCNAWAGELAVQGKVKGGQALLRKGATVSGKNGRMVSDGPFAEVPKSAVGGYMVLEAESLEEAIAIAKGHPILAYDTSIEIRPVTDECPLAARMREAGLERELATAHA